MLRSTARDPQPAQAVASRPLNTPFVVNMLRSAIVSYSVQQVVTASIAAGQSGICALLIASDPGMTQNLQTLAMSPGSQTYTLAIALQGIQNMACSLMGFVPAGYWVEIKTTSVIGAPAFTFLTGQEILVW